MAENKMIYMPLGKASNSAIVGRGNFMPENRPTYKDYMFLASKIKMRAQNMITFERLEQVLNAGNVDTAARLLAESGWPNMMGMSAEQIEEVLSDRWAGLMKEFSMLVPEDQVLELFQIPYDCHNAKTIIKGEGAGVDGAYLMSRAGRVAPDKLRAAYEENDFRFIPPALAKGMTEAKAVLAKTQNPQLADFVLDKACFGEMREMVGEVEPTVEFSSLLLDDEAGIPFMEYYCGLLIDRANLRTCVRCVRMGKNAEYLRSVLLDGGNVSADYLAKAAFAGDGLVSMFVASPLQEAASLGMTAMKGGSMTKFEKECDDGLMRYLSNTRLMYFGVQLIVWYFAVEDRNITNIRMILTGLRSGIDPARLRERLRETYV